jgi:integrase
LKTYAFPVIGKKSLGEVTTDDMLRILNPIWQDKTETASRVRNRIELVWSYAKARKICEGENPAAWRGNLATMLPKPTKVKKVRHHPALQHARVSAFLHALSSVQGAAARCLELAILTATRSQESRLATWQQFDLANAVWEIPPVNMKAGKPHRVPLSPGTVALLQSLPRIEGTDLLFPSMKTLKPLSDMALTQTIRRMDLSASDGWRDSNGDVITAHGFRSSFRDWAGETTNHAREVVEHALAHQLPDKAEASYARGTLFDKRRQLMNDWASHCIGVTSKA